MGQCIIQIEFIPTVLAQSDRFTAALDCRNPKTIQALMPLWGWLYQHYFRVTSDGWEHVPVDSPFLATGSHNGGLAAPDMFMLMYEWFQRYGTERPVYGLMHPKVWEVSPQVTSLAMECGAIPAHPQAAMLALRQGFPVLVYPGGMEDVFRPHRWRHRINFAGRTGFIKLALRENVPIVPVISTGAHDSLIVLGNLYPYVQKFLGRGWSWPGGLDPLTLPVYLGLPWGIACGPLPNIPAPVQVHNRICTPISFDRSGREAANDPDYVQKCYQQVKHTMQRQLIDLVRERRSLNP
jgi:1-acyl-sn-glycerol-3-phosphate acyltransferase